MAKKTNWLLIIAILAVLYFGPLGGQFPTFSATTPMGTGDCSPDTGQKTMVSAINPLDDQRDRVSTQAYLLQSTGSGSPTLVSTITTQTTKAVNFTESMGCDAQYYVTTGNASSAGYYYSVTGPFKASAKLMPHIVETNKVGSVDAQLYTDTNSTYGELAVKALGTGETGIIKLYLKENTADAVYGQNGKIALCISHNTTEIAESKPANVAYTPISVPNLLAADTGEAYTCYGDIAVNLKDYSTAVIDIAVTAKSGVNPVLSTGDVVILDYSSQLRGEEVKYGYWDFDNSATAQGGLDVTQNEAIRIH
jgi:hypothetical protein